MEKEEEKEEATYPSHITSLTHNPSTPNVSSKMHTREIVRTRGFPARGVMTCRKDGLPTGDVGGETFSFSTKVENDDDVDDGEEEDMVSSAGWCRG